MMTMMLLLTVVELQQNDTGTLWMRLSAASTKQIMTASMLNVPEKNVGGQHPDKEHWYEDQLVDHFLAVDDNDENNHNQKQQPKTWSHRYYEKSTHFGGPGHPIFLVLGGEGPAERLFYPFVQDHLAPTFRAFVLQPEHRFYGASQPVGAVKHNRDYVSLLSVEQALADFVRILEWKRDQLGCSSDKTSQRYCPVSSSMCVRVLPCCFC